MSGRVSIVSVALLVTTLGWPTVAASQPRTTPEVNAIAQFRAQLTLPQANAARGLIVDRERCYRRAGG